MTLIRREVDGESVGRHGADESLDLQQPEDLLDSLLALSPKSRNLVRQVEGGASRFGAVAVSPCHEIPEQRGSHVLRGLLLQGSVPA